MKFLWVYILMFYGVYTSAQNIELTMVNKTPLENVNFYGVDKYNAIYYAKKNTLYKKTNQKKYSFSSLQLGTLTSVDIINPLKLVLFYKNTNTVVLLDDKLSEITRIDFNSPSLFRTVGFATKANSYDLWIFNEDTQELELFNYRTKSTSMQTQPVNGRVLQQKSNFNYCWLLTDLGLVSYNSYGSYMDAIHNEDITDFSFDKESIFAVENDKKFKIINIGNGEIEPIKTIPIDFESFYMIGENLYLYDGKILYQYLLTSSN